MQAVLKASPVFLWAGWGGAIEHPDPEQDGLGQGLGSCPAAPLPPAGRGMTLQPPPPSSPPGLLRVGWAGRKQRAPLWRFVNTPPQPL